MCSLHSLFSLLGDREMNRNFFNAQFGSLFRTDENPTYFLRRLSRFADIYMASLSCLLNYEPDYTFYPRRTPLQHELPGWSDQLCTGTFRIPFLQETVQVKWALALFSLKWAIFFFKCRCILSDLNHYLDLDVIHTCSHKHSTNLLSCSEMRKLFLHRRYAGLPK